METHVLSTAPEIERQLKEAEGTDVMRLDAFVAAAGTGGTIGGCGKYFKSVSPNTRIVLSDCDGSCLKTYIATGELKQREGEAGTTAEGIGCGRLSKCTILMNLKVFCVNHTNTDQLSFRIHIHIHILSGKFCRSEEVH